ncbi:nuclear transport factor 2 family protein [Ulvibacterium sp.]|uniref:nuclear transport factor 2 family protein n=1 Tax=Ulvibacterium sp. TaxID=2665914 RepID=UPI00260DC2D8|nr:nuclear transport factor 2 family protein [Ulvibacterium sp.]
MRIFLTLFLVLPFLSHAQPMVSKGEKEIMAFEVAIENAVANGDIDFLEKAYAKNFVFTHGSGDAQNKEQWLNDVKKASEEGTYISRVVNSQNVTLGNGIAIIKGKTTVTRKNKNPFWIQYTRIYKKDSNDWQLLSHLTTNHNYTD